MCSLSRLYLNNPRSLGELKHNIDQTIANSDPETFRKPEETLKRMNDYFRGGRYV
jgi:hypothetical protein